MSNNWKTYKLSEITEYIGRGISPKYTEEEDSIRVINQRCIRDNKIIFETCRNHDINKKGVSEVKFVKQYDVLVNSTGVGTLGRVAQFKESLDKITVDSHVSIVRPIEEFADEFFGYAVINNQPQIESLGIGSTGQTELSRIQLGEQIEVNIPNSKVERKAIANILSAIDDKIENNLATNKTLEEMAMALYKHWFVDFGPFQDGEFVDSELGLIPKGWEVKKLKDFIDLNPRLTLPKLTVSSFIEMKVLPVNLMSVSNVAKKEFKGGSKFQNDDTLFARITPCLENGKTAFVDFLKGDEIAFGSTEFLVMRAKPEVSKYWVYCLSRDSNFRKFSISTMVGSSGRQRVQNDPFLSFELAKPSSEVFNSFSEIIEPWFAQVRLNTIANQSLTKLRDTLLPKLISGEIRLKEFREEVEIIL
jgi:type I restriction enzyme S subunit